jgi:hypothetical protein
VNSSHSWKKESAGVEKYMFTGVDPMACSGEYRKWRVETDKKAFGAQASLAFSR